MDKSGAKDNTIICLWSDHGWHLGEKQHWRKFALWEEATKAPMIWVVPGVAAANGVCSRPVDTVNIYPTLIDLCGFSAPKNPQGQKLEGVSMRLLLSDPDAGWDRPALTTHGRNNHALRSQDYRYIRYADGSEELYDHRSDPMEFANLADSRSLAVVKRRLAKWLPEYNVPVAPSDNNRPKERKQ